MPKTLPPSRARSRRAFVIAGFVFCLIAFSCAATRPPPLSEYELSVEALPIDLNPKEREEKRFGQLEFLAGFELRGDDSRFGGFSGLLVSASGEALYAVSDRGYWLSVGSRHDAGGRLLGFAGWELGRLLTPEGRHVTGLSRDSEGLARDRDGSVIVSFEQVHRLWRYGPPPAGFRAAARVIPTPPELENAPRNGGVEGVTVLPEGRILIVTERMYNTDGTVKGWLIDNGRFDALSYENSDGFEVTDLAALASGDVLALERRRGLLEGWSVRIRRIARSDLRAGARLTGEEIVRLDSPLAVDNFEGLAVREDPTAGTFLYLISDDNYFPFQRTLLLQFKWEKSGSTSSSKK